jgi:hypothetical protein
MSGGIAGDLGVDVLIVGAGLQGLTLAGTLSGRYSLCIVDDPSHPVEFLDSDGRFSSGYGGNDVARIQPARRAAAWWALWAGQQGLAREVPVVHSVPAGEEAARLALWREAGLDAEPTDELPAVLRGGRLEGHRLLHTPGEVIADPAEVLSVLRAPVADAVVAASVDRFASFDSRRIDDVTLTVGDRSVSVLARYVVFAADAANAALVSRLAARMGDPARRRRVHEQAHAAQANLSQTVVAVRGDLPELHGHLDGLRISSHDHEGERVWLISPPPDPLRTTLGPVDLRFEPTLDDAEVSRTVAAACAVSPELFRRAHRLRWATWTRRRTQHPMRAEVATTSLGHPVPARLETFGVEGLLALWPSHPAYARLLADVAGERIDAALGVPADFSAGLAPADLRDGPLRLLRDRWAAPGQSWEAWEDFAHHHDVRVV